MGMGQVSKQERASKEAGRQAGRQAEAGDGGERKGGGQAG